MIPLWIAFVMAAAWCTGGMVLGIALVTKKDNNESD